MGKEESDPDWGSGYTGGIKLFISKFSTAYNCCGWYYKETSSFVFLHLSRWFNSKRRN